MTQSPSFEQSIGNQTLTINEIPVDGYERVIEAIDPLTGLHAFIAVHNTTLGPALGGTRMYPYASAEEALNDVLRLAEGMTYKSAIAEVGFGGGKSVIIGNPHKDKSPALFHSFAAAVNAYEGNYICAEDMGISPTDMAIIGEKTLYATGLNSQRGSGDPSPFTAWGVFRGIQAVAKTLWGSDSLENRVIAVQGIGHVGRPLVEHLFWSGAKLIVADIDHEKAERVGHHYRAKVVSVEEIHAVQCDIFVPCAIGGILNPKSVPQLRCRAVAGGANNQLLTNEDAESLKQAGILFAPDFVINAGGVINVACEMLPAGYDPYHARHVADKIYDSLLSIFAQSAQLNQSPNTTAFEFARKKIAEEVGKRVGNIHFHR
jgi:leucine dehydrogenase